MSKDKYVMKLDLLEKEYMSIKNEIETLENRIEIPEEKQNEICVKYVEKHLRLNDFLLYK